MVVIDLNFLKDIDGNKECKFNPMIFQISSKDTVKDFINDVFNSRSVKGKLSLMPDKNRLRFWKLDSMLSLTDCFTKFQTIVSASSSYDYQIPFPGIFLNPEPDTKIEDLDITEQDYIFLEVRLDGKAFTLVGDNVPLVVRCEGCLKYLEITSSCACNKVPNSSNNKIRLIIVQCFVKKETDHTTRKSVKKLLKLRRKKTKA